MKDIKLKELHKEFSKDVTLVRFRFRQCFNCYPKAKEFDRCDELEKKFAFFRCNCECHVKDCLQFNKVMLDRILEEQKEKIINELYARGKLK